MADLTIKANDTHPDLVVTLSDESGAVDLTSATQVKLIMKSTVVSPVVTVTGMMTKDPDQVTNTGRASYGWIAEDTATPDTYDAEFEVTWPSSEVQTFPNSGYKEIVIEADLG